jgi:hypothetical protein
MAKEKKVLEDIAEKVEAPEVKTPAEVEIKTTRAAKIKDTPKSKLTVTGIAKGWLWVKDEKENGYMIRITEEYKKYKIGDTL